MKVSYTWLNRHIDLRDITIDKLGEILTSLGLEVEGIESYSSIPGNLEGIVIGKVMKCEEHPDADRLKITQVDVGEDENLQIVCGAPNVALGQTVAVATVGTILYPDEKKFEIKKARIRGLDSYGMICAEDELSLGDSHNGIMVLPDNYEIGKPLNVYFPVFQDTVYDIGLTPNRSDATHHRGVARDLLAYFTIHSGENYELKPLDLSFRSNERTKEIKITIENPEDCPRYAGVIIDNIEVKESPNWIQNLLKSIGQKPVNNLVDITNFILHDIGQPLHVFDYEKIQGKEIRVKHLPEDSKFLSLDEKEITLSTEDIMICDEQDNAMCIAGVYGGVKTGVTESTKTIFLESAHFNPISIRKTSMRHNLRTDAAKVFEKGSNPAMVDDALIVAIGMITQLADGQVVSDFTDIYPVKIEPQSIIVRYARVCRVIGKEIEPQKIKEILSALNMVFTSETKESVTIQVPTDKNDVLREIDVIEEILRIYGFDNISASPYTSSIAQPITLPESFSIKKDVSKLMQGTGFLEMMNVSLTDSGYFENEDLIFINNTSNQNLDVMRPDMVISAIETARYNIRHKQNDIFFYEWGSSYKKVGAEYAEYPSLSLMISGKQRQEHWKSKTGEEVDFYTLKAYVNLVLRRIGIDSFQNSELSENSYFSYGLNYHRGPLELVELGKIKNGIIDKYNIDQDLYVAVFNWRNIEKNIPTSRVKYSPINKYPTIQRDLALITDKHIDYESIMKVVNKNVKGNLVDLNLFDIYEDDAQFGEDKHSLAIRLELEDKKGTMTEEQVDKLMSKLIQSLKTKLGIELR